MIGRRDWPCCWMIDPLDGTREFLEGTGEFTVNIALIIDAEAVLGLIAAPNRGYLDLGVPGWGARRFPLFSDGPSETLSTRPLDPNQPLIMCASARHREERVQMMLANCRVWLRALSARIGQCTQICDLASGLPMCIRGLRPVTSGIWRPATRWSEAGFSDDAGGRPGPLQPVGQPEGTQICRGGRCSN